LHGGGSGAVLMLMKVHLGCSGDGFTSLEFEQMRKVYG